MTPEQIRELYDFNAWANQRAFDACAALTPEQFTRDLGSSFPSVRDTLAHIVAGEWIWLLLWLNRPRTAGMVQTYSSKFTDLASIRAGWDEVERERRDFLAGLTAADLDRVIEYQSLRVDRRFAYPLRQMLQHIVNHSTYHRGQLTTLLRQLGAQPCATDFLYYFDWLSGHREG
ncbi:MAG TPA: DinB family protein [Candidatus Acidoferrales bacterium]|jgi:uncharacterized damage-inducible protein DinB|nr:DinB family protein [Candidatus Acidoferrales bacterium]